MPGKGNESSLTQSTTLIKRLLFFNICQNVYVIYGLRVQLARHTASGYGSRGTPAAERATEVQHKSTLMSRTTNNSFCMNKTAKASRWGGYKQTPSRHSDSDYFTEGGDAIALMELRICFGKKCWAESRLPLVMAFYFVTLILPLIYRFEN